LGFNFAYPVPTDFLRLLSIKDGRVSAGIRRRRLAGDPQRCRAPLNILYLYVVSDPGRLPPPFSSRPLVEARLRHLRGPDQSNTKKDILAQLFAPISPRQARQRPAEGARRLPGFSGSPRAARQWTTNPHHHGL